MTPKEKAKELIKKFIPATLTDFSDDNFEQTKECAVICIDEIISACEYNFVESYNTHWWNKVKQEIEKL